jgi:hypothetical protein
MAGHPTRHKSKAGNSGQRDPADLRFDQDRARRIYHHQHPDFANFNFAKNMLAALKLMFSHPLKDKV